MGFLAFGIEVGGQKMINDLLMMLFCALYETETSNE